MLEKCPECGRMTIEFDPRRGFHNCLARACSWSNKDRCAYSQCKKLTNYPDVFCKGHRELYDFCEWHKNVGAFMELADIESR